MIEDVLKVEYGYIKTNLRIVQRKPTRKKATGPRPANKYKVYCDEMKAQHPAHTLVGNLQNMVSNIYTYVKNIAGFISSCRVIWTLAAIVLTRFV